MRRQYISHAPCLSVSLDTPILLPKQYIKEMLFKHLTVVQDLDPEGTVITECGMMLHALSAYDHRIPRGAKVRVVDFVAPNGVKVEPYLEWDEQEDCPII